MAEIPHLQILRSRNIAITAISTRCRASITVYLSPSAILKAEAMRVEVPGSALGQVRQLLAFHRLTILLVCIEDLKAALTKFVRKAARR